MFRNILVPLDGTALADYALPYAARLARHADATLHLVRVVEPPMMWQGPGMEGTYMAATRRDEVMTTMIDQATTHLRTAADRLARTGLHLETAQLEGLTTSALLNYERAANIDLVTMCGKGRTGLSRVLFGSVADRLLREGSAPVLRVRPFGAAAVLPQALIPLDGSAHAEAALDLVEQLVRRQVVREVRLLRVIGAAREGPEAERYLEMVGQRLERQAIPCRYQVMMGDVVRSIREQAGTDTLVVMATHGRHGLVRLARGSVTDQVGRGNVAAVLLIREAPKTRANLSILPIHAERAKVSERAPTRMSGS
jgi:nucleotide-binding universal stress UspA family protein